MIINRKNIQSCVPTSLPTWEILLWLCEGAGCDLYSGGGGGLIKEGDGGGVQDTCEGVRCGGLGLS